MCYLKIRQSNREVRGLAVCHEYRLSWAARNCTRGEGGPFEFGNLLISSHREPLSSSDGSVDDGDDGIHCVLGSAERRECGEEVQGLVSEQRSTEEPARHRLCAQFIRDTKKKPR